MELFNSNKAFLQQLPTKLTLVTVSCFMSSVHKHYFNSESEHSSIVNYLIYKEMAT